MEKERGIERQDISGERISVSYAGRDREMAYATIKNGECIDGFIHHAPKFDGTIENMRRLGQWAHAIADRLEEDQSEAVSGE